MRLRPDESFDLANKVALVTGGATGIGRATCFSLADIGVGTVIVNYRESAADADTVARTLTAGGIRAIPMQADIADQESVKQLLHRVEVEVGRLDYLVNNAGTTRLVPFRDLDAITPKIWDQLTATNLYGAFFCCSAAGDLLARNRGAIVNVASIAGHRAVGSSIPYGVTKAGLLQLTRSLAVTMAPDVRVNSVSAGTVLSGWHEKLVDSEVFARSAEAEAGVVPLRRLAHPEDIAQAIVSMLLMDFVTGQDLIVDGGKSVLY
ncbi:SDR family NAD(P)-dependent oxidoreductase [Rhodoglobus aureus]|uniref:SDR family oxidoreductase n=1 Tax=Rhodoglobus aureus TaxID=191497 RepID=A0ABN1VSV2_9MICO